MYIPFEENIEIFALVGLVFVVLWILLYRKVWIAPYDPILLGVVLIGLNCCFIASVLYVDVFRPLIIMVGIAVFMVGFRVGIGRLRDVLMDTKCYAPRASYEPLIALLLALGLIISVADFWINIRPELGMVDDVGSSRFLLGANNRFLSIAGYPARALPLVLFWLTRNLWLRWACVLFLIYEPIFSVVNGGKGAVVGLSSKLGVLFFLYRVLCDGKGGGIGRPNFILRYKGWVAGFILGSSALLLVVTPFYVSRSLSLSGYMAGLTVIGQRLLLGFDSAFMAIQINMDFPSSGLNLFQLWFASPLKVLGLFSSEWNGINEYVAMNFMSLNPGQRMQFPNNFMVLEVLGSIGWIWGIPLIAILGYLMGRVIKTAAAKREKLVWAFWFGVLACNPFQLLIDGQSFITSLFITGVLSIPIYFVNTSSVPPVHNLKSRPGLLQGTPCKTH